MKRLTDSHAPDKGLNGTLGSRIDGVLGHTLGLTSDGAHEDDPATSLHPLVGLLSDEKLTTGVDVENTVKLLGLDLCEVAERNNSRVGAADVELAEMCDNIIHKLDGLLNVANIGLEGMGIGAIAQSLDLLDDRLSALDSVGVVDSNLGPALCKLNGHSLANTTA